MDASVTNLQSIIEGTKQYVIPLFQRIYSWSDKQWKTLWEDIIEISQNEDGFENDSHFIGSIVSIPINTKLQSIPKFLLIDGQQRMTTILILLAALRDVANETNEKEYIDLAVEIHETLLVNKHKKNNEVYKFIPTNIDSDVFNDVILNNDLSAYKDHKIYKAYMYFKKLINSGEIDLGDLKSRVTSNLAIVSIVLDTKDNPNVVFESLNFKGQPLDAVDLIRNHLFMNIDLEYQQDVYEKYWLPMEQKLEGTLTEFFRHYLIGMNIQVKQNEIYMKFKNYLGNRDAIEVLKQLSKYANLYAKLTLRSNESEKNSQIQHRFERLNVLEARTVYPYLLHLYNDFTEGKVTDKDFIEIIFSIENYVIRRFICSIDSKQMNKMFGSLYNLTKDMESADAVEEVKLYLQLRGYPSDNEIREVLKSLPLYGNGDRAKKTKYILSGIEEGFGHKEKVDLSTVSIEHIMPQTLTSWWEENLGSNYENIYFEKIHVLGNLTLTGYNAGLSNENFEVKKKYYANSNLQLNKDLANYDVWNAETIEERSNEMIELFLSIWKYFGKELSKEDKITGSSPRLLTIKEKVYMVSTWKEVMELTLTYIVENTPEKIEDILKKFPKAVSKNSSDMRQPRKTAIGLFIETKANSKLTYKRCLDIFKEAGNDIKDWDVEIQLKA
jgi:uncharacterized protein with ParB-like and HNH nuclease domain